MKLSVELPDTPTVLDLDPEFARTALITVLYRTGKLSRFQACEALGLSPDNFDALLPRFGFSDGVDESNSNTRTTDSLTQVRRPHPSIAGKGKILGDLIDPIVEEGDWECLK